MPPAMEQQSVSPLLAAGRQGEEQRSASPLLELPHPLLLAVLQCLAAADDYRSLFSAARAHSRLNEAAVAVLSSMTVGQIQQQQRLDGMLLFLGKHGQHVSSISLRGAAAMGSLPLLQQLPDALQLHRLELNTLRLQLLPRDGCQGLLGCDGVSTLKQLRLSNCVLLDGQRELVAALAQLPSGLQHLSISDVRDDEYWRAYGSPTSVLQGLQQLTHLELDGFFLRGANHSKLILQSMQALSRLLDLQLSAGGGGHYSHNGVLTASMLSGAAGLTRLELRYFNIEPDALAGKTQLQHLKLCACELFENAETAQLLTQLGSLQQLTHLDVSYASWFGRAAPVADYSALTASSKLQHLHLNDCTLPAQVWQHVFPTGRQLPHLTSLEASYVNQPSGTDLAGPEGSCLVNCCPGLRLLDVRGMHYGAGALAPLQGLSGLHTLMVGNRTSTRDALWEVCQLTRLRHLTLHALSSELDGLLLQTTQLRQLTRLTFGGPYNGNLRAFGWVAQAPGDQPIWCQVLRLHLDHSDPVVTQAAAAALEAQ